MEQFEEEEQQSAEPASDIYLFQAVPKDGRMEGLIPYAVGLGVYEIIPVAMKNCVDKIDERKVERKRTKWQAIADTAAQKQKRAFVPHVHKLMSFGEMLAYAREHCDIRLAPYEGAEDMHSTLEGLEQLAPGKSVGVLIGPEGGFAPDEIETVAGEWAVLSLGRRILNTDTAAVVMLSALILTLEAIEEEREKPRGETCEKPRGEVR